MACAAPLAANAPRESRKVVTAVFCDVVGSTAMGESNDPEAVRIVLARYFERMKGIVERHGGTVEKFIGDAVVGVFGVPVVHEDDALRACRAAVEMRDALPELGIVCRIGVNTGEVMATADQLLASGDAVNVAARLEQAAPPGEILVGESTFALTRSAVDVEVVEPLSLKGKAEPVPVFRLLAVTGELSDDSRRRWSDGRPNCAGYATRIDRRCTTGRASCSPCSARPVSVSRGSLPSFSKNLDARVVRGRCLSYGEGITYWPVVEVVKQLASLPDGEAARPLRSLLGETQESTSADEIAWSFRKLLEQEAQLQPLVVVFDDLHWAEETLIDLVEHVADLSRDAPLLLFCMARPELLERRPVWGGGKWNATTILLEPLDAGEAGELIGSLGGVSDELQERIVQIAEGNPLFLEEMLALVQATPGATRRGTTDDSGTPGCAARSTRPGRALGARARLGRGASLSSWRSGCAGGRRIADRSTAALARAQAARPT